MRSNIRCLFFILILSCLPVFVCAAGMEKETISNKEEQDTLSKLKNNYPAVYSSLLEFKKTEPQIYKEQLLNYKKQIDDLERMGIELSDYDRLYKVKKPLPELTRREEQDTLSKLKNNYPAVYSSLLEFKKTEPQIYKEQLLNYKKQIDDLE